MANRIQIPSDFVLYSTTDLQGTILSASDDFAAINGYSKEENDWPTTQHDSTSECT